MRRTSMPLVGFEHAIPAIQWAQTYGLESTDIGIGEEITDLIKKNGTTVVHAAVAHASIGGHSVP